ncbi:transcription termination factor 2, mitochondrial isoform X2 [Hyperolius riggenbachi]|uniref:transcription termination factor 2, mitochondrial isoform X2 n=1 Tax=Hyperolius riggenbachi TaxID=752182 RepID=UPI0035A2BEB7
MLKTAAVNVLRWNNRPGRNVLQCNHCYVPIKLGIKTHVPLDSDKNGQNYGEENQKTVESLYRLSIDIKKIRRLKSWVLCKDVAFVEETADILKDMGASTSTVANILESCPEAFLQRPTEITVRKSIWNLVCPKDHELIAIIEKFPDSFFCFESQKNQQDNIVYFQDLGLGNRIICRLLTGAPQIFCNQVEDNKERIDALEECYRSLGGTTENFRTWLMKLLSQDPFVLSKSSLVFKENVNFLQNLGFTDLEVLKLLSKLKGFIFDMTVCAMEHGVSFTKGTFGCSDEELRQMIKIYTQEMVARCLKSLLNTVWTGKSRAE